MTTLGLCTHFSQTDEWAFDYALALARKRGWQLNICHWLHSPYKLRRDVVQDDLFQPQKVTTVTPQLLNKLELQLREYYDPKLEDFTEAAFKLCEGLYQVELVRCFRQHLLDLVVMGYQPPEQALDGEQSLEDFARKLHYPLILVGYAGPGSFLLNASALEWLEELDLPEGSWEPLEAASPVN